MFYAEVFNKKNLFLRFNNLKFSLLPIGKKAIPKENQNKLLKPYEMARGFLNRAYFAYETLNRMVLLNQACILQFNNIKCELSLKTNSIVFESQLVREHICQIMPVLNTIFILQDKVMPIFANVLNIKDKMPMKFSAYISSNNKFLSKFPVEIQNEVEDYWNQNGKKIRKYRNLNQHEYDLLNLTYLQIEPEEKLLVLLPDNPYEKVENFTYHNSIDAFEFLKKSYMIFHNFVEEISKILGFKPKIHDYESPDTSFIDLETHPDNTTICVSFIGLKEALEVMKGEGFPCKIKLRSIPFKKNVLKNLQ